MGNWLRIVVTMPAYRVWERVIANVNYSSLLWYNLDFVCVDCLPPMKLTYFLFYQTISLWFLGDICPAGHYCPKGSTEPLKCKGGMYCGRAGLPSPSGNCSAGFYCNESATVPNQFECYPGHFCTAGTEIPQACEKGTFASGVQNKRPEDCVDCTGGYYCGERGRSNPTGPCAARYLQMYRIWNYTFISSRIFKLKHCRCI